MTVAFVVAALTFLAVLAAARVASGVGRIPRVRIATPALEGVPVVGRLVDGWHAGRADQALPGVMESVARALRSGSSLAAAVASATPAAPPRLVNEWHRLVAGAGDVGIVAAADRWRSIRPSPAVALVASALAVASEVGGPQARAIDGVALTLRQRQAIAAELRALTAQSRASAGVLALAPLAFAAVAGGLEPRYLPFLFGTPTGWAFLASGVALLATGLLWMARLTRIS